MFEVWPLNAKKLGFLLRHSKSLQLNNFHKSLPSCKLQSKNFSSSKHFQTAARLSAKAPLRTFNMDSLKDTC